jgi:hypothetical protein
VNIAKLPELLRKEIARQAPEGRARYIRTSNFAYSAANRPNLIPNCSFVSYFGYTATAPLYDYAGPASAAPVHAAPHGYGPLIYTPQLYAPTPAFPTPPAEPSYYTAQSVVVSQPLYDYAPDVNRAHKGSKLTPDPAAIRN